MDSHSLILGQIPNTFFEKASIANGKPNLQQERP